ncbi:hypothetical protein BTA35_0202900 [Oceanospirillum linum]|uniref:Lipoprotein n=1 Tax=Oceanospirillum linum TaxID=966 RepID=A0A1T1HF33_OCELI|nr:hypothetical protein BTA35_0202900 [Oceanospirillum linum]SEF57445.1 hypothetical protein SAMN04489856_101592 [Oleiphilus messinensis]SMP05917.1 hypothetical protein SAMN06264348_101593 [Oceanospirillum linum]
MLKTVKIITGTFFLLLMSACTMPYYGYQQNTQAQGNYVRIPPAKPQPQRRVIIRTETHRVLTPKIVMEPCCKMQSNVIYRRY